MRKREEIEEQSREQSQGETWDWEIKNNTMLMLEVLLDIRELLTPVHSEPAKLSDTQGYRRWEEIRK